MTLAAWQSGFLAEIAAPDDGEPASSPGMEIYRQAYRGRLAAALEVSFERTRRWVGEQAFSQAAAHYILTRPSTTWTLDAYGADFPALLGELFANDPEVTELAWLEWALQQAYAAQDCGKLDPADLAKANLSPGDWDTMRFTMAPGFCARTVATGVVDLWRVLARNDSAELGPPPESGRHLIVWRQHQTPHYRLVDSDEFAVLDALAGGMSLGQACLAGDPSRLGEWLAQWLGEGLFSGFAVRN